MPMINNNVSVIKKWLDQGGDLSKLLAGYSEGSFKELADLLKDDKTGLEAISKQLKDKVDKVDNMGLSEASFTYEEKEKLSQTQIFTDDLKTRLENNTFDGYITVNDDLIIDYDQYTTPGIYKVYDNVADEHYSSILIVNSYTYEDYWVDQILIHGYHIEMRTKEKGIWSEWKKMSVSQADLDKIKEIIYKDNNKTIVLSGDVVLFKGIDIKGYTELNENIVKYPSSIDSISVNGKKINNESIKVDNLYSIDENIYDSLNCSFDKITNIQKVKHIYLPDEGIEGENNTDKKSWVYSGMQSTKDYNLFYINLQFSHIDGDKKPILSTKEYYNLNIYNSAKGYWKEGNTFKELEYTYIYNTFEDRTFFFQDNMPRLWFVSRQGEGYSNIKVDANNPNPQIPIELFFEKQITKIDVTDKYSELWECIENNGAGQKVEIKDNHSHLLESEIQYGNLISNNKSEGSSEEIEAIKADLNNKVGKDEIDSKLSTTSTNPVQNKVITAELNKKANKELAFDDIYDVDGYSASYSEGVYKAKNGFVIQRVAGYSENSSYYGVDQYWYNGGEVYFRSLGDEGGWQNDWRKISVSQNELTNATKGFATKTDLNTAIGDIETSLDNIIKKYGLGGDGV